MNYITTTKDPPSTGVPGWKQQSQNNIYSHKTAKIETKITISLCP